MRKKIRNLTLKKISQARTLRKTAGLSEQKLWSLLRYKQLGFKFRRQYPAGPYVLDFYCPQAKVCVELDGDSHCGRESRDARRDAYLENQGIATLRVTTPELYENPEVVVDAIWRLCEERRRKPPPVSSPFSDEKGERRKPPPVSSPFSNEKGGGEKKEMMENG